MLNTIKRLNTAQFRVSLFYYLGNFFLNFFRYLFHLILLRLLTPNQYGEFLTYLSLMYLLAIPTGTISSLITKVVSDFSGSGNLKSINSFFYFITKKTYKVAFIVCIVLVSLSKPLSQLFKAHQLAFVVLGLSSLFTLMQTTTGGYLLGLQKFSQITILGFFGVVITTGLAVILIGFDYGAVGAVIAQILSGLIVTIISFFAIKSFVYPKIKTKLKFLINLKEYLGFSLINSLGFMSLISIDILLVRIFFSEHSSGIYSSVSVLGRMIFFALAPLSALILPVASKKFSQNKNHSQVFKKLGLVLLGLSAVVGAAFILFPRVIISLLSGSNFLEAAELLPLFAVTMILFSASQFILSYLMATGRQKANIYLLIATIMQPVIISFFHSSLYVVVIANLIVQIFLLIALLKSLLNPLSSSVKIKHAIKA